MVYLLMKWVWERPFKPWLSWLIWLRYNSNWCPRSMCSIAIYFSPSNLLFRLTQEKNIWGPFLVVAPASVLNNWADEISRFCPDLKTLPYWGGLQERMVLRKNINPKRLYRR